MNPQTVPNKPADAEAAFTLPKKTLPEAGFPLGDAALYEAWCAPKLADGSFHSGGWLERLEIAANWADRMEKLTKPGAELQGSIASLTYGHTDASYGLSASVGNNIAFLLCSFWNRGPELAKLISTGQLAKWFEAEEQYTYTALAPGK